MRSTLTLSWFLTRDFARSLYVIVPPALTLALYRVFFLYRADVAYFAAVGGVVLGFVCLTTTLLFASLANRAALYPLLARVPRRAHLIAAIVVSAISITVILALIFGMVAQWQGVVQLTLGEACLIAPRWLALFVFVTAFGLHLSKLVSRGGSNLLAYGALIVTLSAYERERLPFEPMPDWLAQVVACVLRPLSATIVGGSDLSAPLGYAANLLGAWLYAAGLFALALWLFRRKDLLWVE
jgi:hypothetical protein